MSGKLADNEEVATLRKDDARTCAVAAPKSCNAARKDTHKRKKGTIDSKSRSALG